MDIHCILGTTLHNRLPCPFKKQNKTKTTVVVCISQFSLELNISSVPKVQLSHYMCLCQLSHEFIQGWSGGAMVLGKLPVPGRPTIWITVGQGPTALAVGAGGGCLDIFTLIYPFFLFLPLFGRRPDID